LWDCGKDSTVLSLLMIQVPSATVTVFGQCPGDSWAVFFLAKFTGKVLGDRPALHFKLACAL
jgi:hypothetical protein